jgi:hypothetical protein
MKIINLSGTQERRKKPVLAPNRSIPDNPWTWIDSLILLILIDALLLGGIGLVLMIFSPDFLRS